MNSKGQPQSCNTVNREGDNNYTEYYIGEKDRKKRRNGRGENHWTGPEVNILLNPVKFHLRMRNEPYISNNLTINAFSL